MLKFWARRFWPRLNFFAYIRFRAQRGIHRENFRPVTIKPIGNLGRLMRSKPIAIVLSALVLFSLFLIAQRSMGQSSQARLITQAVNESKMITLQGNTHPYARAEFDRGAAPASLAMDRMMLVLKRNPLQESTLATFLAAQVDPTSPSYHKWLTPDQFGARFGAADEDIAQIISWLGSQGFQVTGASHGRGIIEFSGN